MPFVIRPHRRLPVPYYVTGHEGRLPRVPLAYFYSCLLLISLLMLNTGVVWAGWVLASGNDETGLLVYIDSDSIRRKGDTAKMWQLYDYRTVQTVAGDSLLSMKRFNEFDCVKERTRTLGYTWFSGNMGNGTVVFSTSEVQQWEPVGSRTINRTLWKAACDRKVPSETGGTSEKGHEK